MVILKLKYVLSKPTPISNVNTAVKRAVNDNKIEVMINRSLLIVISFVAYMARVYLVGELILFLAILNVLVFSKDVRKDELS